MRLVYLESPLAGDVPRNVAYARACMLDCLKRGEAPFVSHLLYTQCLDDLKPEERSLGMEAGFCWSEKAELSVFYIDFGMSGGMRVGMERAQKACRPISLRVLPRDDPFWDSSASWSVT
jgi:hypothetical protein